MAKNNDKGKGKDKDKPPAKPVNTSKPREGVTLQNQKEKPKKESQMTEAELLNSIYNSPEFLSLSPESQRFAKATIDSYTPAQLRNINITKKEAQLITKQARAKAKKERDYDLKQLDMDREESLRMDTNRLKRYIDEQTAALEQEKASGIYNDQRIQTIRNLQDSLSEANTEYEQAAELKNKTLQNSLDDINRQLETETGRANEDKIIELRQRQREYTKSLRDTQNNMAQRGLAFSGIRAQEESELEAEYEDYMTTAELEASRRAADAERTAMEQKRDAELLYEGDMNDLLSKYGGLQREAIQSAEATLGSGAIASQLEGVQRIGGGNVNDLMYGGVEGSQAGIIRREEDRVKQNIANEASYFEGQYGSKALNTTGGAGQYYTPVGGIKGILTRDINKQKKPTRETYRTNVKAGEQALRQKQLLSKL